jgi:hypothetical protein
MTSRRERTSARGGGSASSLITPVTGIIDDKNSPKYDDDREDLPSYTSARAIRQKSKKDERKDNSVTHGPCRVLFGDTRSPKRSPSPRRSNSQGGDFTTSRNIAAVTPSPQLKTANKKKRKPSTAQHDDEQTIVTAIQQNQPSAKRRLVFGRYIKLLECAPNVQAVYKIIRKLTGNIGGNGYSGPIYGELTMHSMQKMINLMVDTTGLNTTSRFLDVGSGIGKPNLHVAQSPGVAFSCGVEIHYTRWALGMTCLKSCVDAAVKQRLGNDETKYRIQGNTMFLHMDITEARTFNPFTHVYMFSIGFPPELWVQLSEQWNNSNPKVCQYLICYHGPRDIVERYRFQVELVAQTTTSMHGSKEAHMGYVYQRISIRDSSASSLRSRTSSRLSCDPLFEGSFRLVQEGLVSLQREVHRQMLDLMGGSIRATRSRQRQQLTRY